MIRKKIPIFIILFSIIIAGCTTMNPYNKYYTDYLKGQTVSSFPFLIPSGGEVEVYSTDNMDRDGLIMWENGYKIIGHSSFNATNVNNSKAIKHAKNIGAQIVLLYSQYTHSEIRSIPFTSYDTITSNTQITGDLWGSATTTTTTTVRKTTYIPYSVLKYDYLATFWVKTKTPILGTLNEDLSIELRQQIERNKGVYVRVVVKGTPAFNYGIIPGDVIIQIGNTEINNAQHFQNLLLNNAGKEMELIIVRKGEKKIIKVNLNEKNY